MFIYFNCFDLDNTQFWSKTFEMNKRAACLLETSEYDESAFLPRPMLFGNIHTKAAYLKI